MSNASLRRRAGFLSALCLLMAIASGIAFLILSEKLLFADHGFAKWPGLHLRMAVAEQAVTIDYEQVNEIMGTTGTDLAVDQDTEWNWYIQQRWIGPAVRRGLLLPVIISFLQTLVFFFLAILFWSDRPAKASREAAS